jgi:hypothetical protein
MTTITLVTKQRKNWHLPAWALVLGFSLIGLTVSLALVATSWPDGPVPWF